MTSSWQSFLIMFNPPCGRITSWPRDIVVSIRTQLLLHRIIIGITIVYSNHVKTISDAHLRRVARGHVAINVIHGCGLHTVNHVEKLELPLRNAITKIRSDRDCG